MLTSQLLAARHLATLSTTDAASELFRLEPLVAQAIIRSLLVRLSSSKRFHSLAEDLIRNPTDLAKRGALLVLEVLNQLLDLREQIATHKLAIISESTFPVRKREQAGRVLSRLGYPLDLAALADIPAGNLHIWLQNLPQLTTTRRATAR